MSRPDEPQRLPMETQLANYDRELRKVLDMTSGTSDLVVGYRQGIELALSFLYTWTDGRFGRPLADADEAGEGGESS